MAASNTDKKRILVVDDSIFARKITTDIIQSSPRLEVVGCAVNGIEALSLVEKLKPDVVTLDIEMPKLNGLETLERLMKEHPTPVVMLSSLTTKGAQESIQALKLGAVDVMAKPHGSHSMGLTIQRDELIAKVLAAADVKLASLQSMIRSTPRQIERSKPSVALRVGSKFPVVIIASSTGGPRALRMLVPELTDAAGVAYVLVQHLPAGFSGPLARDLDNLTNLSVREASEGDSVRPNEVLFAPAGFHTVFDKTGTVHITSDPPVWGVRPSADVTITSAIQPFGRRLIGVILTGMGRDGASGTRLIKEAGGNVIAEHESSCVVYGMPRAAVEIGSVDIVAPLQHIGEAIHGVICKAAQSDASRSAA